ncbi:urease accessory protein UreD [Marimonas lutisalis]|uniref:urease accessory protein UreD n=1 Tax=Marimonas lutisalis TaxID=2545756 RepID=UPI0010F9D19B|nr:urease accessory protein UreD [Marimonas lutisalis]
MPPRSFGTLRLSAKARGGRSVIDGFRCSGATKVAFPAARQALEAIVVNTAGGVTGGDQFDIEAAAGPGSRMTLTTQAAERAYRSQSGQARIESRLRVAEGAVLHWLPQELILFNGADVARRLSVSLEPGGELLLVEPVVFGRIAMQERLTRARFRDRIEISREGRPLYFDAVDMDGAIDRQLGQAAVAMGARAMASAVLVSARAESLLQPVRRALPGTGGASLLSEDVLVLRLLADDAFFLRKALIPSLEMLAGAALPKSWSL